ncbi:MAG: hypothetical protein PVG05_01835 [Gammaproteobacteria bacterium]|jgi:hypothetical protein
MRLSLQAAMMQAAIAFMIVASAGFAQEAPVQPPSQAEVIVSGVSPERFNPTYGTAFFRASGAYFPADPRDVAVLIGDRQLPAGNLSVTRRIVAANYVMPAGPNVMTLRAWDNSGQVLTRETRLWAGNLTLEVAVVDGLGNPVGEGELTARLAADPAVSATAAVQEGRAEVVNLPDEDILLEVSHPDGRRGTATARASERRASVVLR